MIGYDLDPVPVLQTRASLLQIPLEEKEQVFQEFLRALERKLQGYFQTRCRTCNQGAEVQFVLYGARKSCRCGEGLVIDSFLLREESNGSHKNIGDYYPAMQVKRGRQQWRLFEKGNALCQVCSEPLGNSTELPFPERYASLVIVGFCRTHGQFFKAVDKRDLEAIAKAKKAATRITLPEKKLLRVLARKRLIIVIIALLLMCASDQGPIVSFRR